ncbi:Kelch-like protein diablo, partial [Operophtera brumata]
MSEESQVRAFYKGKNFFITGGTGFVGLCLIEKILRCIPESGTLYLLMRPKKGKDISSRLEEFPKNPVSEVLFAVGGWCSGDAIASVERFDPASGEWKMVAPMSKRRCGVGVAVLHDLLYAVGGHDGQSYLNSIERYDPQTNQWCGAVAPTSSCRTSVGVAVLEGALYAVGGQDGVQCLNHVERYEPKDNRWTKVRAHRHYTVLEGALYAVGGRGACSVSTTSSGTSPRTTGGPRYVHTAIIPCWRARCTRWGAGGRAVSQPRRAVRAQGQPVDQGTCTAPLYRAGRRAVRGGGAWGVQCHNHVEWYEPKDNRWTKVAPMTTRRLGVAVSVLGGMLYAVGGSDGQAPLNTVERYDPRANKWTQVCCKAALVAAMSTRRKHLVCHNQIYAVGGRDDCTELSSAESCTCRRHVDAAQAPRVPQPDLRGGRARRLHGALIRREVCCKAALVAAMSTRRKHLVCHNQIYAVGGRDDCMELSSAESCTCRRHVDAAQAPRVPQPDLRGGRARRLHGALIRREVCCKAALVAAMSTRRKHLVCHNQIYAVGGRDDCTELSSAESCTCRRHVDAAQAPRVPQPDLRGGRARRLHGALIRREVCCKAALVAAMSTRRKHLVCHNQIYAVGGRDDCTELSSAESCTCRRHVDAAQAPRVPQPDLRGGRARRLHGALIRREVCCKAALVAAMSTRRKHLVCHNQIYAVGGRDDCMELSSAERYEPSTDTWSPVVAMTSRRSGVGLAVLY